MGNIRHFRELDVYKLAMDAAMEIFELSKGFPVEERYSLTDQIRRCSRSVCANIAEAWRKRRYSNAFISACLFSPTCHEFGIPLLFTARRDRSLFTVYC